MLYNIYDLNYNKTNMAFIIDFTKRKKILFLKNLCKTCFSLSYDEANLLFI